MHEQFVSKKSLSKNTLLVAVMTLLSRLFGFARDMVIAQLFGATFGVDAFLVANKIPNFFRRLFAEGAFSQAFVPVLSEYRKTRSDSEIKVFLNHISGVLAVALFIITIVGLLFAPIVIMIFAPGFGHYGARYTLASEMLRVTFPYLMFVSLTALCGAILNSYDRFGVPAFTPVLLNICIIIAALFISPHLAQPITALAIGVFIAGIVQLLFQFPFLLRLHRLPMPRPSLKDPGVRKVMKLMVPALFGVSVAQINIMIDQWYASFLQVGSISWLYYSDRITQLPLGVFGIAIATVILPSLSRQHAGQSKEQYSKTLDWGLRTVLLIGIPATVGCVLLAGPILSTLFQYGEFTQHDVLMARQSLMAFGIGLFSFMLIKVLASGFYAQQNIKLPVKIGVVAMVANTILGFSLIWSLHHAGLALATSLSAMLNAGLLYFFLRKKQMFDPVKGWSMYWIKLFIANLVMGIFVWFSSGKLNAWLDAAWQWKAAHLLGIISVAIVIYFALILVLGLRKK